MSMIATAVGHIRDNADLLTRNGYNVNSMIESLNSLTPGALGNADATALVVLGTQITNKGVRMAQGRGSDGERLALLGINLSNFIARGVTPARLP